MTGYLIAWLICILGGALAGALLGKGKFWILIGTIGAAIISGVLLLVIWAILTISQFFGIPLIIVVAIVIVAWLIFRR